MSDGLNDIESVHDNQVYGYSVDCEGRRLIFYTVYPHPQSEEFTDVVFEGVFAHFLEYLLPGNILFDVEETDVAKLVRANARMFEDSWRYGWPPIEYRGDLDLLISELGAKSVRAYVIDSSYGLSGWVLASGCERKTRGARAKVG
jgi:hypothetical protein